MDDNLYKTIIKCFINSRTSTISEIFVIYEDGTREKIWTFDHTRYEFTRAEFIEKTKIEAVFHCDRKQPRSLHSIL